MHYRSSFRIINDIQNIIEIMDFQHRLNRLNKEYHQVFHFLDTIWDSYTCPNPNGRCVVRWREGIVHWFDGKYHRNPKDGPAIELANGTKEWWFKSKLHRKDGPAVEYANGDKEWWFEGKLHRTNGPAIEYTNGRKVWCVNGQLIK